MAHGTTTLLTPREVVDCLEVEVLLLEAVGEYHEARVMTAAARNVRTMTLESLEHALTKLWFAPRRTGTRTRLQGVWRTIRDWIGGLQWRWSDEL